MTTVAATVRGNMAGHDECSTSIRGCLAVDVSAAGVAASAQQLQALIDAQRAEGYRHACSYRHVLYFEPDAPSWRRDERCFVRACDATFTRITDPAPIEPDGPMDGPARAATPSPANPAAPAACPTTTPPDATTPPAAHPPMARPRPATSMENPRHDHHRPDRLDRHD